MSANPTVRKKLMIMLTLPLQANSAVQNGISLSRWHLSAVSHQSSNYLAETRCRKDNFFVPETDGSPIASVTG